MRKPMPTIREFMTRAPETIESQTPLPEAQRVMRTHDIRHLPVRSNGKLVGVVSERNIETALSSRLAERFVVEDVMISYPYVVHPDSPLDEVTSVMAHEKFGCAIVEKDGKVVGIFTTVDSCRVLCQLLETVYPE